LKYFKNHESIEAIYRNSHWVFCQFNIHSANGIFSQYVGLHVVAIGVFAHMNIIKVPGKVWKTK